METLISNFLAQPIQTRLQLLFTSEKTDVSQYLEPDLLSFEYDDKETDEADEISITLKDSDGKWAGSWKPDGGEIITANILSGTVNSPTGILACGKFYVDTMRTAGSPRVFEMKAISIPLNKPIRKKLKTRAWEGKTIKAIAQTIATEAGVTLFWDCADNPVLDRQDQKRESDLKFLSRICKDNSLSIKVTDDKIVIFDQASYESKEAIKTLRLGADNILAWDFESQQSNTYKSVTITYRDPRKKVKTKAGTYDLQKSEGKTVRKNPAVNSYTYTDEDADENGQEYSYKKRAKSIAEAKRLAKAKLHELNQRKITGSVTVVGDVQLQAGLVITIAGIGSFDGNFIISNARHSVGSGGYKTTCNLRRVNAKY